MVHLLNLKEGGPAEGLAGCQSLSILHLSMEVREGGHLQLGFRSQQDCSQDLEL